MKKNIFIVVIIALILSSCDSNKTKVVKTRGLYNLEIPEFLSETYNLNTDASLQYQNELREFYVVGIHESKKLFHQSVIDNGLEDFYTSDLDGYTKLLLDNLESSLDLDSIPSIKPKKINGLNASTIDFSCKIRDITVSPDEIDIYWKFTYIEGKNNYYQIIVWTLADRREEYQSTIDAIADSFVETDKSKK